MFLHKTNLEQKLWDDIMITFLQNISILDDV